MLCADMVDVQWKDKSGVFAKVWLIWKTSRNLAPVFNSTSPFLCRPNCALPIPKASCPGKVRYCVYREIGYFLGIEFESDSKWSARHFKPQHLLDPRRLVIRSVNRASKLAISSRSLSRNLRSPGSADPFATLVFRGRLPWQLPASEILSNNVVYG